MTQGAKTFLLKDLYDVRHLLDRAISKLECGKDDSWPHRFEELRALLEDAEEWAVVLYGGQGLYEAVRRGHVRSVENLPRELK